MASKKLLVLVILTVAVFVGLVGYGDFKGIGNRLAQFPIIHLIAALGLAAANYGLRFLRWSYYLKVLGITVPRGVNVLVFLSGLAMSITPAKVGELLKSYLLRDRTGIPVTNSAPVVIMERLTDVASMVLLAIVVIALLPVPVLLVLVVVLVLGGGAILLIATRRVERLFALPLLRRWDSALRIS